MKKPFHLGIILILFVIQACNRGSDDSLQGKKDQLKSLREKVSAMQLEIKKLETDIALLDTAAEKEQKVKQVLLTEVRSSEFRHYVSVQGVLEAEENLMLSPRMPGMVKEIRVREGDVVAKGQVLAILDDDVLKKSIDEVRSGLDQLNVLYEKQKSLWEQKIGTEIQYITLKNQKEGLENKLKTLEAQLSMAMVTAPFPGIVDAVYARTGSMAAPGAPMLQLVNTTKLKASAKVPDSYVSFVRQGDNVRVSFPDLNREIDAKVRFVGRVVDPLSRTFKIEIDVPAGDPGLKPNLLSMVRINDKTLPKAIVIDENIIQPTESGKIIFVAGMDKGKSVALQRIVSTGLSYDGKVEILSGLQEGEQLITTGFQDLSDKQIIRYENR
jgi:membrane fusion protein (multidrug efflux system)